MKTRLAGIGRWTSIQVIVLRIAGLLIASLGYAQGTNQSLPSFDFTIAEGAQGWNPAHDISQLSVTSTGMLATISGTDPYLTGPAKDYPESLPLWAKLRVYADQGGTGQLFYYNSNPTEPKSVHFQMPGGRWVQVRVPLPPLGKNYRLRIDPPGTSGKFIFSSLGFEERTSLPDFDFTTVPDALEWSPTHDIRSLVPTDAGLAVDIAGSDPYMSGPARDYPSGKLLWLRVRLKSDTGGMAQVFYYNTAPSEGNSVRFYVPSGGSYEAAAPIPALGPGWRIRIDPPGDQGSCVLERLWFEERALLEPPPWPRPLPPVIGNDALALTAGELTLKHSTQGLGAFELSVGGEKMAVGNAQGLLGYAEGLSQGWASLNSASNEITVAQGPGEIRVAARVGAPNGARWNVSQVFTRGTGSSIRVETRLSVDRNQTLVYFPAFMLLPGLGTFGTNKAQAVFCGLEYLDNEPSSSEADITSAESKRQVPDSVKITLPLMALAAREHYVGLVWDSAPEISALFDSPDRVFGSGGHVLGLLIPGSNGANRREGDLLPYMGIPLAAGQEMAVKATIIGGGGTSIAPALEQYVALKGLPARPSPAPTANEYYNLTARSWLDSRIRTNNLYRHAYWPGFGPQPSSDAPVWMEWLGQTAIDAGLKIRLSDAATMALQKVPAQNYLDYTISHVTYPALSSLIHGSVSVNALAAQRKARAILARFEKDGSVTYKPSADGLDYGKTHFASDANGLTATHLQSFLEHAVFSGDTSLISTGLHLLNALGKFRDTVPRGAQTWEVPLHTPDILASAKLLRCYTLGYELTGDSALLEQARYWAWTGVPFVYLTPPVPGSIGLYATIPVFGATAWVGSWFGVPVQWCGLVYSDALYRFARHDPDFPWKDIADGIALSGAQQSWGADDAERLGLLPDFFLLRPQTSAGPAINPGTLQASAVRAYGGPGAYDFRVFRRHGLMVHAAGDIGAVTETDDQVAFTVANWSAAPCHILINGVTNRPLLKINGIPAPLSDPHVFQPDAGRLVLRVQGTTAVELITPAPPKLRIQRSDTNAAVNLYWPASAADYVLEVSHEIFPNPRWQTWPGDPSRIGETLVANETAGDTSRFFRLRQHR